MSETIFSRLSISGRVTRPSFPSSFSLKRVKNAFGSLTRQIGWATIVAAVGTTNAFAQAGGGTSPAAILTNICNFILGPFGQSLAVLGIIAIGLSWMFGRASLGLIAGVVGGIVLMFGASFLARTLIGG
jgi:type IV secretion system protein VirB2